MGLTVLGYQHWWSELAELASSYVITHSLTHSTRRSVGGITL